jgi:hypothetical protein
VLRFAQRVVLVAVALCTSFVNAENTPSPIVSYFTGKEVVVKIDMPGTQKGIDLRFNKDNPMDWKEYSSRLKQYGVAIRKGDTARVTGIVVSRSKRAITKRIWKGRSPTPTTPTANGAYNGTWIVSGRAGNGRKPTTATLRRLPARSRRKRSRTIARAAARDSTCAGQARCRRIKGTPMR